MIKKNLLPFYLISCLVLFQGCLGDFSVDNSVVTCPAAGTKVPANTILTYNLKAVDQLNNPITSQTLSMVTVSTVLASTSSNRPDANTLLSTNSNIGSVLVSNTSDGNFPIQLTSQVAGQYNSQLFYNGVAFGPVCTVTFTPLQPSTATFTPGSLGLVSTANIVAGNSLTLGVLAFDVYGNPSKISTSDILNSSFILTRTDQLSSQTNTNPPTMTLSNAADGEVVNVVLSAQVTGTAKLTLFVNGVGGRILSPFTQAKQQFFPVTPGNVVAQQSTVDYTIFKTPTSTESTTNTLYVRASDAFGNQVPASSDERVPFVLNFTLVSDVNTVYSFSSSYNVRSPLYENINYGPITKSGFYVVTVSYNGILIQGSPFQTFQVLPDTIFGTLSLLTGFPQQNTFHTGVVYTLSIIGRDKYGNNRLDGEGVEDITFDLAQNVGGVTTTTELPVTSANNGTFLVDVTFPRSGNYTISASVFDVPLSNSGVSVTALAPSSGALSTVSGDGAQKCKDGSTCRFLVMVNDVFGNPSYQTFSDVLTIAFDDNPLITFNVNYLALGIYAVEYSGVSYGTHPLSVKVNGQQVSGSPFKVNVEMSDLYVGIISGGAGGIAILASAFGYVIYRDRQLKYKKQLWEERKKQVYQEYAQGSRTALVQPKFPNNGENEGTDDAGWDKSQENLSGNAAGTRRRSVNKSSNEKLSKDDVEQVKKWVK